jgi:galacturonosyltransferase
MTVVLIANDSTYIYNTRYQLLAAMRKAGYRVVVICEQRLHTDEIRDLGCELVVVTTGRRRKKPWRDFILERKYKKVIKNVAADVVLTFNIKPNCYAGWACRVLSVPYVANVAGLGTPFLKRGPMWLMAKFLYKHGLKSARCVFFQNEENQKFFQKRHMVPRHQHLLPGSGVDLQKYHVLPYPYGDKVHFLYIARLIKSKGIEEYLDAAEVVHDRHPETVFHILGGFDDKRYRPRIEAMQLRGIVEYHGEQPDTMQFQAMSSCTVHPSYYPEGMSNVLLESAACGRPIITTDLCGCREILDDGVNGFLCREKDSKDLIEQIESFLRLSWEEREKMGLAGRKKVEREFDRQLVVDAYLKEIRKIVNGRK